MNKVKLSGIPVSCVKPGDVMQLPNYLEPLEVKSVNARGPFLLVSFLRPMRNSVTVVYSVTETVYISS